LEFDDPTTIEMTDAADMAKYFLFSPHEYKKRGNFDFPHLYWQPARTVCDRIVRA
jgi:hypothetical protein